MSQSAAHTRACFLSNFRSRFSALGALPSGRPSHRCDTCARRGRRCLSALFTPPPSSCRAVAAARERALRTRLALTVPPARHWPTADRRRDGRTGASRPSSAMRQPAARRPAQLRVAGAVRIPFPHQRCAAALKICAFTRRPFLRKALAQLVSPKVGLQTQPSASNHTDAV